MIDHFGFPVRDFKRSQTFYETVLAPLGYGVLMQVTAEMTGSGPAVGFGAKDQRPKFWLVTGTPGNSMHIAFTADSREAVDAFYDAALAVGAKDNGPPGLRPHYHADYYGAFVFDPDGHNIEAVCHKAP